MSYSSHKGFNSKPMPGCQINWMSHKAKGLVGLWLFNEKNGNVIRDIGPNKINVSPVGSYVNSSYSGFGWVPSKNGGGWRNAPTGYLEGANHPSLQPSADGLTVQVTCENVRPPTGDSFRNNYAPFRKLADGSSGWMIYTEHTLARWGFFIYGLSPGNITSVSANSNDTGIVKQITGVYNARANTLSIYINGILNTSTAVTGSPTANTSTLIFGRYQGASTNYYDGIISQAAVWSRPLNAMEVYHSWIDPYEILLQPQYRRFSSYDNNLSINSSMTVEHILAMSSNGSIPLSHILAYNTTNSSPVSHLLSVNTNGQIPLSHILNVAILSGTSVEHLLSLSTSETFVLSHLVTLMGSVSLPVEAVVSLLDNGTISLSHLLGLSANNIAPISSGTDTSISHHIPIDHLAQIADSSGIPIATLVALSNQAGMPISHILDVVNSNGVLSVCSLAKLVVNGTVPVGWLTPIMSGSLITWALANRETQWSLLARETLWTLIPDESN